MLPWSFLSSWRSTVIFTRKTKKCSSFKYLLLSDSVDEMFLHLVVTILLIVTQMSQSSDVHNNTSHHNVKHSHLKAQLEPELPYARIGDSCDPTKFSGKMMPYYGAIVSHNLTLAREVFDSVLSEVQGLTGGNQTNFIKEICFAAAMTCPTDKKQCDCLSIEPNFKFVENAGTCRADEGTQCLPFGYKCRDHYICKDYKCVKQNRADPMPANWCLTYVAFLILYHNVE